MDSRDRSPSSISEDDSALLETTRDVIMIHETDDVILDDDDSVKPVLPSTDHLDSLFDVRSTSYTFL